MLLYSGEKGIVGTREMAREILAPPLLTGEAAEQLLRHLEQSRPNPETDEMNRLAIEFYRSVPRKVV